MHVVPASHPVSAQWRSPEYRQLHTPLSDPTHPITKILDTPSTAKYRVQSTTDPGLTLKCYFISTLQARR